MSKIEQKYLELRIAGPFMTLIYLTVVHVGTDKTYVFDYCFK